MDPIVQLTQTWRQGLGSRTLSRHLTGWAETEPALARFGGDIVRLFGFFRTPPSPERDAVFCALLREAKRDPLAGLVVLEALLPGLKALSGKLLVGADGRDELMALLLDHAWERIVTYPVERRPGRVAANVLLDTRKATLGALEAQRPIRAIRLSSNQPAPIPKPGAEQIMERAVAAGALGSDEAELILQTRIDGRPLRELADERRLPYQTLLMRRIRAERRLSVFLGRPAVSSRGRKRHMSTAQGNAVEAADSASGGAGQ